MTVMTRTSTHTELLACISPVLDIVHSVRQGGCQSTDIEALREQALNAFDEFERDCYANGITASDMQEAKFALTAYLDEQIMASEMESRMAWMARPLQLELFGNSRAGEAFFEKLTHIRQAGASKRAVIEVYFVCMQLGFEGVYKIKGVEQLKALMLDVRAQLEELSGKVPLNLSDTCMPAEHVVTQLGRRLPYWVIFSITVAVLLLMYLGFHQYLQSKADEQFIELEQQVAVLTQLEKTGNIR
ncbi:hypothetical protein N481_24580 [Pseudoalteromonas luteoviolacea S4047-1]|uniref:Type IV / VI secretion system DotU domain-containing protein n=2 Tax=Pseudoalteromonas luteoviolacea TaxID=43657 RepID=A0A0F6A6R9_9GAMM|nr:hypothetical protein N479_02500 [Pseudoalteromonas luteoviolacea S4054]KZN66192.1 hypothetical protein N481_24580 [Pseudoalteromonas luteoviolacea S4047-1]